MLNLLALLLPSRVYTPDLKALRHLYELLDGEQWTNNRGWIVHPCGEDTTYCNDWELAKCEADSTHLDLHDNALQGTIPPELGDVNTVSECVWLNGVWGIWRS